MLIHFPTTPKKHTTPKNVTPPTNRDYAIFFKELECIDAAGIPFIKGVRFIIEKTDNPSFQSALKTCLDELEENNGLFCEITSKYPTIFRKDFCSFIKIREYDGNLIPVSDYFRWKDKLDQAEMKGNTSSTLSKDVLLFAKILPYLVTTGLCVVDYLDILSCFMEDRKYQNALVIIIMEMKEGSNLSDSMLKTKSFPLSVCNAVGFGEEICVIGEMLQAILPDLEAEFLGDSVH